MFMWLRCSNGKCSYEKSVKVKADYYLADASIQSWAQNGGFGNQTQATRLSVGDFSTVPTRQQDVCVGEAFLWHKRL